MNSLIKIIPIVVLLSITKCSTTEFMGKVVIVTGSSSGIGAAAAEYFAKRSAKLVLSGRNEERLAVVAKAVERASGIKPLVIKGDLTRDYVVRRVIDETIKEFGRIDVLVNNAGAGLMGKLLDGINIFDKMISTNLRSVYLLTTLAVPYLIKTKGNIINVSSVAAINPITELLAYSIAKAGIDSLTKGAAKELAAYGIRVNSVNPGAVLNKFFESGGLSKQQSDNILDMYIKKSPLGYLSTSENVADLIGFLASDKAKSITGSTYVIDNGYLF